MDNAFVTFRYADQLAQGNGIRFNTDGPETEGFVSWLWLIASAAAARADASIPVSMMWVSVLIGALSIVVLWHHLVAEERSEFEVALPLIFLATSAPYALYAVSGTGTTLFSFLLLLTVLLSGRVSSGSSPTGIVVLAVCGTLLALCRPEGVIVLPVIVVVQRLNRRPALATTVSALIVVLVVGAFGVWRSIHFGSLLPPPYWNGVAASVGQRIAENLRAYFMVQGYNFPAFGYYYLATAIVASIGWSVAGRKFAGTETAALGVCAILATTYLFFVDLMPGMRYHAALVPLLMVPGVHAVGALGRAIDKVFTNRGGVARVVVVVSALIISAGWMADLRLVSNRLHNDNEITLVGLGIWLGEHIPPGSLLSTDAPGIMPYYSRLETVAIQPHPITGKGGDEFSLDGFLERPPDVVVLQSRGIFVSDMGPVPLRLTSSSRFRKLYRALGAIRFDWFHDRSYRIYVRKELKFDEEQLENLPQGVGSVRVIN
jgi:arabinofuranosyltransferase